MNVSGCEKSVDVRIFIVSVKSGEDNTVWNTLRMFCQVQVKKMGNIVTCANESLWKFRDRIQKGIQIIMI